MTVETDRDAKTMTVTRGAVFDINLWEDRTRGELWVPSYDAACLALVTDDYFRMVSNNAVDAGKRVFQFKALAIGGYRLLFEKRLGWKFTAEDRRVFVIHAVEDGLASNRDA